MAALGGVEAKVYDHFPNKVSIPAVVVLPDDPYVIPGTRFGEYQVNLRVLLVTSHSANRGIASEKLDSLIQATVDALSGDYGVNEVEQPSTFNINDTTYLGTSMQVQI